MDIVWVRALNLNDATTQIGGHPLVDVQTQVGSFVADSCCQTESLLRILAVRQRSSLSWYVLGLD